MQKRTYSKLLRWELIVALALCILYYLICMLTRGEYFDSIFFGDHGDSFADFFKCVYGWNGNPYRDEGYANYPALALLMYKLCYHFLPIDVSVENGLEYRSVQSMWVVFLLYNLFVFWLSTISISKMLHIDEVGKKVFYAFLLLSFPVMFSLERGNQINLAFAFTIFFIAYYEDENKYLKELSYISLALAAGIKIYPAIFGVLLVRKGKWKETIRLVIYGCILFFVPFLYYGNGALHCFISSLLSFSDSQIGRYGYNFSLINIFNLFLTIFNIEISEIIVKTLVILVLVFLFIYFIVSDVEWKRLLSLTLIMVFVPSISDAYLMLFMIAPYVSFISEYNFLLLFYKKLNRCGMSSYHIVAILFMILFIPWALPVISEYSTYNYYLTYSYIVYFLVILLFVCFIISQLVVIFTMKQYLPSSKKSADCTDRLMQ